LEKGVIKYVVGSHVNLYALVMFTFFTT